MICRMASSAVRSQGLGPPSAGNAPPFTPPGLVWCSMKSSPWRSLEGAPTSGSSSLISQPQMVSSAVWYLRARQTIPLFRMKEASAWVLPSGLLLVYRHTPRNKCDSLSVKKCPDRFFSNRGRFMKSLVVIAAMALTVMAGGCMQHEQPQIGAKTGTTGSVPKTRFVEI